jgi:hypothetical protein
MDTIGGGDAGRRTICPACGYPSAGLCAACIEYSSAVSVDPALNTVTQFVPAA